MKNTKTLMDKIFKPNVWLVERVSCSYVRIPVWISKARGITTDPQKAKKFSDRESARFYIKTNDLAPDWCATEHEYIESNN